MALADLAHTTRKWTVKRVSLDLEGNDPVSFDTPEDATLVEKKYDPKTKQLDLVMMIRGSTEREQYMIDFQTEVGLAQSEAGIATYHAQQEMQAQQPTPISGAVPLEEEPDAFE